MSNILAIYGTSYGHTERIVHRITEVLSNGGHEVTLIRGDLLPPDLSLTRYDGFLIAASVLFGRHQRYIRGFVRRHAERLNVAPSALVSVCGSAGGRSPEEQQAAKGYIDRLLQETGWRPRAAQSIGGVIAYTRYGPITRWVIRQIARRKGGPTDTSRDHETTDWAAVDSFARDFAALLPTPATAGR